MSSNQTRDIGAIDALRNKHVKAVNLCDLDAVLSGMTEDVVSCHQASRRFLAKSASKNTYAHYTPTPTLTYQ